MLSKNKETSRVLHHSEAQFVTVMTELSNQSGGAAPNPPIGAQRLT